MYDYEEEFRVRWIDADASGRIHYTNMFRYFETAEIEFLRAKGLHASDLQPDYGLPRVHVECDFLKPIYFDDLIRIGMTVETGDKSITFNYDVFKSGEKAAEGKIVTVVLEDGSPVSVPEEFRRKLKENVS